MSNAVSACPSFQGNVLSPLTLTKLLAAIISVGYAPSVFRAAKLYWEGLASPFAVA